MFCTRWQIARYALLMLALFAASVQDGWGDDQVAKNPDFSGKITAVSEDGQTFTVERGGKKGSKIKNGFKLVEETKFVWDGLFPDSARKLKLGDTAHVVLKPSSNIAAEVRAECSPDGVGKIAAVSADGKELMVEFAGAGRLQGKVPIKLNDKTKVLFREGEARLRVGYQASVWLAEGSKDLAFGVEARAQKADAFGNVTAVSEDGKTLTVEMRQPKLGVRSVPVKISEETKITFGPYPIRDKTIKVGYQVFAYFKEGSSDTAVVMNVGVPKRNPDVSGRISAVSADGKTLTLETLNRGDNPLVSVEIKLTAKTDVLYMGIEKEADQKFTIGLHAAIWLQAGMKNTAEEVIIIKPQQPEP